MTPPNAPPPDTPAADDEARFANIAAQIEDLMAPMDREDRLCLISGLMADWADRAECCRGCGLKDLFEAAQKVFTLEDRVRFDPQTARRDTLQ
ncbi:MAG: hypothetical protein AAGI03_01495 [Pseudomonadota bacterium]